MIVCHQCGETAGVVDSRITAQDFTHMGIIARRRRACKNCGYRFTTYEVTDDVIRRFLANIARLQLLRDAINGKSDFEKQPKTNSIAKAIEYYGNKDI